MIGQAADPHRDHTLILANLHYTHFYLMEQYKKTLADYGITAIQSNVLGIVDFFGESGASLEEIKEMVLEPNSDVSRIIGRLAEKKFVEKIVNPHNRRKLNIRITKRGNLLLGRIQERKVMKNFTAALTPSEVRSFTRILEKLRK